MNSQPMMTGIGKDVRLDMLGSGRVLKFLGFCWIRRENQGTRSKIKGFGCKRYKGARYLCLCDT